MHVEWINNEVLYSTSNHVQSPGINYNEKEYKRERIYVYNQVTLLYSRINIVNYSSTKMAKKMGKEKKVFFCTLVEFYLSVGYQQMAKKTSSVNSDTAIDFSLQ